MKTILLTLAAVVMLIGDTYYILSSKKGIERNLSVLSASLCTPACLCIVNIIAS